MLVEKPDSLSIVAKTRRFGGTLGVRDGFRNRGGKCRASDMHETVHASCLWLVWDKDSWTRKHRHFVTGVVPRGLPHSLALHIYITCFPCELATQASWPLFPTNTPAQQQRVMSQQQNVCKTYTEGGIYIAISDIKPKQIQSERCAAEVYSIPQMTIQDRRTGQCA
jgi:hypothetical protein